MRYLTEHMFELIGVSVFAIGFSFLILNSKELKRVYVQVKDEMLENPVVYVDEEVSKTEEVTKEELITTLLLELNYECSIDGIIYSPESFNSIYFDYSSLASIYTKRYIYEKNGSIEQIQYTRR